MRDTYKNEPMDNTNNSPSLPKGWVWTKLEEICLNPQYGWTTSAAKEGNLHLLRTSDITSRSINWNSVPFCKKEPPEKEKYLLKDGDIVITRAGSVGYSLLINNPKEAVFASYLIRFQPLIDKCYVSFFMKSSYYWRNISEKRLGIAVPNVNATKLKQIPIPLPPLPEQHRIVAKIEELFSNLDMGVKALKKIKEQLKRYRQAVLKYAFEGKLTTDWRQRMLNDELGMLNEKDDLSKFKIDNSDLPELPNGWIWSQLKDVGEIVTGTTPSKKNKEFYETNDFPFYKPSDLNDGYNIINSEDHLSKQGVEKARILPQKSILVTCIGATIGKTGLIKIEGASNQQINAIIPNQNYILPEYCYFMVISPYFQKTIIDNASSTTLPILNKNKFKMLFIPITKISEQYKIVEEIERRFSIADEVEKVVDQSLKQAERLRHSILKKAFEGKLVPQDPTDESAARLLEQIKEEKAKYEVAAKAKKKNKRKVNKKQRRLFKNG